MAGVYKRINRKGETHWYATVYIDGRDTHVPLHEKRNGSSPVDEARARVLAAQAEKRLKTLPAKKRTAARRIIFKTAWAEFVRDYVSTLAENTQRDYHWCYEGHFRKAPFARKRVGNITQEDIKVYVATKLNAKPPAKPLAPHTVNNHTSYLSTFFRWCQQQGYWDGTVNPAKAMGIRQRLPRVNTVYLREAEHALLLVESFDPVAQEKHAVLAATLAWTGIRWSEARSLLWSQVHLHNPKHQHLRIETTAVGKTIQPWTKTPSGDRHVAVCPTLAGMLESWRSNRYGGTQTSEKSRLGIEPGDGLVFPSDAGTLLDGSNFRGAKRPFYNAKKAANERDGSFPRDLQVHGLRHSYSMLLRRQGATDYQIGQELGHSKSSLGSTGAYTHSEAERENPLVAKMVEKSIKEARKILAQKKKAAQGKAAFAVPAPALPAAKQVKRSRPTARATTKPTGTGARKPPRRKP